MTLTELQGDFMKASIDGNPALKALIGNLIVAAIRQAELAPATGVQSLIRAGYLREAEATQALFDSAGAVHAALADAGRTEQAPVIIAVEIEGGCLRDVSVSDASIPFTVRLIDHDDGELTKGEIAEIRSSAPLSVEVA